MKSPIKPLVATFAMTCSLSGYASETANQPAAALTTYATIAAANYQDAVTDAKTLQTAIHSLVSKPSADTLQGQGRLVGVSRKPQYNRDFPACQWSMSMLKAAGLPNPMVG